MKRQDSLSLLAVMALLVTLCVPAQAITRYNVSFDNDTVGQMPVAANPILDYPAVNTSVGYAFSSYPVSQTKIVNNWLDVKSNTVFPGKAWFNDGYASNAQLAFLKSPSDVNIVKGTPGKVVFSFDFMSDTSVWGGQNPYFIGFMQNNPGNPSVFIFEFRLAAGDGMGSPNYLGIEDANGLTHQFSHTLGPDKICHVVVAFDTAAWTYTVGLDGVSYGTWPADPATNQFSFVRFNASTAANAYAIADNFYLDKVALNCADQALVDGLAADFTKTDCKVTLADFAVLATNWAACTTPGGAGCVYVMP